jgi:hypothetical protein
MQGPLTLAPTRPGRRGFRPYIENGALTALNPPSLERLSRWVAAGITVRGRPDWVFVKLHCHGFDPRDTDSLLGEPMTAFLRALTREQSRGRYAVHFVSAREMVNIALAACDGQPGTPSQYRDYRFVLRSLGASSADADNPLRHREPSIPVV